MRDEKPEIAIIIPYAMGELLLQSTLDGIAATADENYRLILVSDIPGNVKAQLDEDAYSAHECEHLTTGGVGLSYARHVGIMHAKALGCRYVVLLDAHMSFIDDSAWLSRLVNPVRDKWNTFACAASVRCNQENMDPVWHLARGRYEMGARLVRRQTCSNGRPEYFGRKWRSNRDLSRGVEVACPLGGAYALSVEWYEHIGAPWELHRGWGCSEQFVALATHALGGRCFAAPVPVGHCYRSHAPYITQIWRVMYNSLTAVELFDHGSAEVAANWMSQSTQSAEIKAAIHKALRMYNVEPVEVQDLRGELRAAYEPGLDHVQAVVAGEVFV